jgi:DNA-binding CsgD family transcriptional regulator
MKKKYHGLLTPKGKLMYANDAALGLIDAKMDDVAGVCVWDCPWFTETPGLPEVMRSLVKDVANGVERPTFDMTMQLPSGDYHMKYSMRAVLDSRDRIVALLPQCDQKLAPSTISNREREVLNWTAMGKTATETGTILGISKRTVEWHLTQVRQKLNAVNITHTIAMAVKAGVIGAFGLTGITGYSAKLGIRMLHILDMVGMPGGIV